MPSQRMMYRCERCGKVTRTKQEALVIVEETRPVVYPCDTTGYETVREIKVCRTCYGVPELPEPKRFRHQKAAIVTGSLCLQLANGKVLTTNRGYDLACFLESDGGSIVPLATRKGGKSKGARGRGRKTVQRTRDAR